MHKMAILPRIGIYVSRFPVSSETFIVTKVLGLLQAGFDIQIFAETSGQDWNQFAVLQGRPDVRRRIHYALPARSLWQILTKGIPRLLSIVFHHPAAFGRLMADCWRQRHHSKLGFIKRVYRLAHFVGHQLDILHIEFDSQAIGIIEVKTFLGCQVLLSSRGAFQRTTVLDHFPDAPQYLYRYVDGHHFISAYLRDNAYKLGLSRAVPSWLVMPAVDLTLFQPKERSNNRGDVVRLVTVGRLEWSKGYEFAMDAVARVRDAGIPVKYTIVGEGSYYEAVALAAQQWGLSQDGTVKLAGTVPRERVIEYLQEADVMIHAAVDEGFCNAVIEGQAAGLPVVVSDAGGLPENVQDGVTGFVVPRRDPDAMAEKIIVLAKDPELRQRMGRAGRERALQLYNIDQQVEAFAALYQELATVEKR